MIIVENAENLRVKGSTKWNMGKDSGVLLTDGEQLESMTELKSGNTIEPNTAVSGTMAVSKKDQLQLVMSHSKEKITEDSTHNSKRMETTETVTNPVIGVNILSQEGTTGSEDNGEKITNQKRWKRLAREKYGSANEGNQSLGKRDGDMDIEEYLDRKKIRLGRMSNLPWIVVGDFNEILQLDEKKGGVIRSNTAMSSFREAVDDCALIDMGYVGNKYTWSNRQFKGDLIQERIDRAFCCLEWRKTFPDAIVLHKAWMGSDHKAIIIDKVYKKDPIKGKNRGGGNRFHFEHAWAEEAECRSIVEKAWTSKTGPKTVDHALWGCKTVKSDWIQCPLFSDIKKLKVSEFLERVIWVAAVSNLDTVTKFITTAWFVWNNRNKILFGDKAKSSGESWKKATLFLSDGKNSENKTKISVVSSNEITKWIPPNKDTFKVNVDAFLDQGRSRFSAGIIIRDSTGRIKRAAAMVFNGKVLVEIAEAKAIHEGLLLAMRSGLHPLIIESDSLNVVRLCNDEIISRSDVYNVISDIQVLLNRDKRSSIVHTPRSCNRIAHEIARRAIGLENSVLMVDLFPPWLQKLAVSDVNSNTSAVE
ncbi:hypothetical protein LWI29_034165 [Acer saccharum]|uniref:RNase H type-1 domain-containing protein n=1 Tax=Acer saccharum TaxID=4024 RepID=A0AA39SZX3_ACESA|nr:hypothetical protein LWI29_034165 [Acer saccharum]